MKDIQAVPCTYSGVIFRSTLEGGWARTLDGFGIEWEYEQHVFRLPSGTWYLPDFHLPALDTFIEVKGPHAERMHKPQELAEEVPEDVIVLIGFPPVRRSTTPYLWDPYLQWRDPLGYDTRLAKCPQCSAWQWLRPQVSRACRLCGERHEGLLAKGGEVPFMPAQPDLPLWMDTTRPPISAH